MSNASSPAAGPGPEPENILSKHMVMKIHSYLERIVSSRALEDQIFKATSKEDAQNIVDNVQDWLDARNSKPEEIPLLWRSGIYALYSLMNTHGIWPASMLIKGCTFDRTTELDTGGGSTIYRGTWNGENVAIKQVHLFSKAKKAFVREVVTWKQLRSPYILPFYGLFEDPLNPAGFLMVSPLMAKTLVEYITPGEDPSAPITPGGYRPAQDRTRLIGELAQAIAYLHARKIVHGDIKDSNILIDHDNHIRVTDFGLSLVGDATKGAFSTTGSGRGSEGWIAPELYSDDKTRRTMPRDVFAFASICYMLITGKAPYEDKTQQTYYKDVVELKQRRAKPTRQNSLGKISVPAELWDVVYGCWRNRPHMRLNMKQVLACLDIDIEEIYQVYKPPYFTTNVLRSYTGTADDDLSFKKGDTVEVLDCATPRWRVRDSDGRLGYVTFDSKDTENCTLVRVQARLDYTATVDSRGKMTGLSVKKGDFVDVVAFGQQWWMARSANGEAGIIPAKTFTKPKSPEDWTRDACTYKSTALADYSSKKAPCHLSIRKGQDIRLRRRPEGGNYFIGEVDGIAGIVPAHFVAPVDYERQKPIESS